jgi:UDP-N-acetylglucosamine 2-epimerase (non-hydrolysing)
MLALAELNEKLPVVFPAHPRSRQRISDLGLPAPSLHLIEPQPYLAFLALQRDATLVITDSGGIQEETSFLGVPCLTVRENTERPITVALGTNVLVGRDVSRMQREAQRVLAADEKKARSPIPLWDGNAADRIAKVIAQTA